MKGGSTELPVTKKMKVEIDLLFFMIWISTLNVYFITVIDEL